MPHTRDTFFWGVWSKVGFPCVLDLLTRPDTIWLVCFLPFLFFSVSLSLPHRFWFSLLHFPPFALSSSPSTFSCCALLRLFAITLVFMFLLSICCPFPLCIEGHAILFRSFFCFDRHFFEGGPPLLRARARNPVCSNGPLCLIHTRKQTQQIHSC